MLGGPSRTRDQTGPPARRAQAQPTELSSLPPLSSSGRLKTSFNRKVRKKRALTLLLGRKPVWERPQNERQKAIKCSSMATLKGIDPRKKISDISTPLCCHPQHLFLNLMGLSFSLLSYCLNKTTLFQNKRERESMMSKHSLRISCSWIYLFYQFTNNYMISSSQTVLSIPES